MEEKRIEIYKGAKGEVVFDVDAESEPSEKELIVSLVRKLLV